MVDRSKKPGSSAPSKKGTGKTGTILFVFVLPFILYDNIIKHLFYLNLILILTAINQNTLQMASKSATLPTQRCISLSTTCIHSFKVKEQYCTYIFFNLQYRFNIQQRDELPPPPVEVMGHVSTITLPLINMTTTSISQSHKPSRNLKLDNHKMALLFHVVLWVGGLFNNEAKQKKCKPSTGYMPIKCVSCCNNKSEHILLHNVKAECFFILLGHGSTVVCWANVTSRG